VIWLSSILGWRLWFTLTLLSAIDRVARELRAAVNQHKREVIGRQSAEQMLRKELRGTLTALMLSCKFGLTVA